MASEDGLSITLKRSESERYKQDGTWMVLHGSPSSIKQYIEDAFGFDTSELTLVQAVTEAERLWRAEDSTKLKPVKIVKTETGAAAPEIGAEVVERGPVETVVNVLGGEVISEESTDDPWADATPAVGGTPPWEEPKDAVIAAIEAAGSKAEIQALYVQHKDEFQRPEVVEAARKRTGEVDG